MLCLIFPCFIYGKSALLLSSPSLTNRPRLWSIICPPLGSARVYLSAAVSLRCRCLMELRKMLLVSLPAPAL